MKGSKLNRKRSICLPFVGLFGVALGFSGCGGSAVRMMPGTTVPHASSKFLYVVNSIEASVHGFSIDGSTGRLSSVGPAVAADDAPLYAAATPDGKFLYVANAGTDAIGVSGYRIEPSTGVLTPTDPAEFPTSGDSQPVGIAVDPTSTRVYTANSQTVSAFAINETTGALLDVPGTPVSVPIASQLVALAITPDGRSLYVTDVLNNRIWEFGMNSSGLPVLLDSFASTGSDPEGVTVDPTGKFAYVANWLSNSVFQFTIAPQGGVLRPSGTTPMEANCGPQELRVDPSTRFLFVSCAGISKIARFSIDPVTGSLTALPSFSPGPFTAPRGIAIDGSGSYLYSVWNMQNKASSASLSADGTLTSLPGTPATGRGPIGIALSGRQ